MKTTRDFFPENPIVDQTKVIRAIDIGESFEAQKKFISEARELDWRLIACSSAGRFHFVFGEEVLDPLAD